MKLFTVNKSYPFPLPYKCKQLEIVHLNLNLGDDISNNTKDLPVQWSVEIFERFLVAPKRIFETSKLYSVKKHVAWNIKPNKHDETVQNQSVFGFA